jgi:hypothetical protein
LVEGQSSRGASGGASMPVPTDAPTTPTDATGSSPTSSAP